MTTIYLLDLMIAMHNLMVVFAMISTLGTIICLMLSMAEDWSKKWAFYFFISMIVFTIISAFIPNERTVLKMEGLLLYEKLFQIHN